MSQHFNSNGVVNPEEFDFKRWLFRLLKIWPWFIVSTLVSLAVSILYLTYAKPIYEASAAIMVKDEKKGAEMMDNSVLKEMGLGGNNKLVENEIEVLKSPDIMESTVRQLNLYIEASRIGKIKKINVFQNEMPFILEILNPQELGNLSLKDIDNLTWTIGKSKNGFSFKGQSDDQFIFIKTGEIYSSDGILFKCLPNSNFIPEAELLKHNDTSNYQYSFKISSINNTTNEYIKLLSIEQATKLATVINLGIKNNNESRAVAILKTLISIYNQIGLDDKNRVTDSTVNFLNARLILVANQLKNVESSVEKFKTKNKVTDISVDEQQVMSLAKQVDVQRAQSETQLNIINAMAENLEKNQDDPKLMPSTLGIEEPTLALLIEQHNQLILQEERISQKSGPKNPLLVDIRAQIKVIRSKLLINILNLKQAYELSLKYISQKDDKLSSRIDNVPVLEKELIEITRDKIVQEQIYAFLLQKREEAAITRASNVEDSRTIAESRSLGKKWPKRNIVLVFGFILGLLFPMGIIFAKDYINNKVGDVDQIGKHIDLPILGTISHVKKMKSPIVVSSKSRSIVSEQIRHIRTSISYTGKGKEIKSILATSFQPSDGKSFVSLNLAASYALLNKKTVILEFDLRKPHIGKYLGIESKEGLSSILSEKSPLEDLLIKLDGYNDNLYFLPAGYLPPNPSELIASPGMVKLMQNLESSFDYIIIDSPPFSLVTDSALLQKYSDITLVVLRQDHTSRNVFGDIKNFVKIHPDNSVYLLLNDVGKSKRYQEGNGYNYNGYYIEDTEN